jgi:hypothetical protein
MTSNNKRSPDLIADDDPALEKLTAAFDLLQEVFADWIVNRRSRLETLMREFNRHTFADGYLAFVRSFLKPKLEAGERIAKGSR